MRPLAGSSESPASSPSALQQMVTKQEGKPYKNKARKVTRHRKVKLSSGFDKKNIYKGIWGPDEERYLDLAKHASPYGEKLSF